MLGVQAMKADILLGMRHGRCRRARDRRLVPGEFRHEAVGAEQEHAAVPEIALVEIARGGRGVGLLDEAQHLTGTYIA
jgi:hypothetical protein